MTNEEQIEEILMEAHGYGLRMEVLETAKQIIKEDPSISKIHAYELAYAEWIK